MAEETGYRRQVRPQPLAAMPAAPNFGEAIGRELQRSGEILHAEQLENYELDRRETRQTEWARFQRRFVEVREDMSRVSREFRKDAGAGHAREVRQQFEERRAALLDGITEDDVRRRASEMTDEFGLRLFDQEATYEEARRVAGVLTDWAETQDISANRIRRLEGHEDYLAELSFGHAAIEGLDIADVEKDRAHREWDQSAAIAFVRGRTDSDPALARAMIGHGLFDDVLTPDQLEVLANHAEVGVRSLEVATRREQAERSAMVREEASTLLERHGNGIEVEDEQFAPLIQAAVEMGDMSLAERLAGAQADNAFARVYRTATPLQLEQRLGELAGKGERSEPEQRELAWLRRSIDSRRGDFERDPAAFLIETGAAAPAIDFDDPDSLARRAAWARAQSRANGRHVPILTRSEAAPFADMLERGQELDVLAALDRFSDPFDRVDAAQVIAPDNPLLHRLAVISREHRATVRAGAQVLEDNPNFLKPAREVSAGAALMQRWELHLAQALREIDPADAEAVHQVMRMEIAGRLARHPGETIDNQGAALFANGVQRALGAETRAGVRRGGLGFWSGGHPFIVAEGYTLDDWSRAAARDRDRKRQAGGGPVNPDGSPFDLNRAHPVWLGGNAYRWETASGAAVKDKEGGLYLTEIGRE